ncbi:multiple epidermal growth factor-like domains 10, partial [Biomphalaria glabrata]
CREMEYGHNCLENCQTKCGKDCAERVFGECEVCPVGSWGRHCQQSCIHCKEDCHKSFGNCSRCVAGYKFPNIGCPDACGHNEYGENCEGICNEKCNGSDCYERIFGECQKCPDFNWGLRCEESCPNCIDACNTSTGACSSCIAGFKGHQSGCNSECGANEYGENCAQSCQAKCGKDCYERRFGECEKCPDRKWGLGCADSCENCREDCDKSYGTCVHCKAGFKRPDKGCIVPCGPNEYGEDCIGNCQEKCGKDCFERQHGICNGDQYGAWEDWSCSRDCSDSLQHRKR